MSNFPNYPVPIFKVDNRSLYRVMFRYKSGIDFHPELAGYIGYIYYFQSHILGDCLTIGIDSLNNVDPIGLLPPSTLWASHRILEPILFNW